MILYPGQGAGMCNRLLAAAHLIAHAEARGRTVVIGSLVRYGPYFEGLPHRGLLVRRSAHPDTLRSKWPPVSVLRSGSFPPGEIPLSLSAVERAERAAVLVVVGWRFRDDQAVREHGDLIRAIFRPRPRFRQAVDDSLAPLRDRCDIVIGVHVRRTDYAAFRGGRFFYSDTDYRRVMADLAERNGRVGFLLASDAPLDIRAFGGLTVRQAPGHELADLYALAGCDYIVGPPSTYSTWAAFYGPTLLFHIMSPHEHVTFEDFKRVPEMANLSR